MHHAAAAFVALSLLVAPLTASATAMMSRYPDVVDEQCQLVSGGRFVPVVYLSGCYEAVGSAPHGPIWRETRPLEPEKFSLVRRGCKEPEPGRWVRDGNCDGLPRYRFTGELHRRYSYDVRGGGNLVTVGAGASSGEFCPVRKGSPAPVDEYTSDRGFPRTETVRVGPSDVRAGSGTIIELRLPAALREAPGDSPIPEWVTLQAETQEQRATLLDNAKKVPFEVEIRQGWRRYEGVRSDGRGRTVPECVREHRREWLVWAPWSVRVAQERRTLKKEARQGGCAR